MQLSQKLQRGGEWNDYLTQQVTGKAVVVPPTAAPDLVAAAARRMLGEGDGGYWTDDHFACVKEIELHNNALNGAGLAALLSSLVRCRNVETMRLRNNALGGGDGSAALLAAELADKDRWPKLKILSLNDNYFTYEEKEIIRQAWTAAGRPEASKEKQPML